MEDIEEVILNPAERMRILVASAKSQQVCGNIPLTRYYRSLSEMYRLANLYMKENNLEKGFVLYVRFVSMLLEEVPKHKDYATFNTAERHQIEGLIKEAMKSAESAKTQLRVLYERDAAKLRQDIEKRKSVEIASKRARLEEEAAFASTSSLLPPGYTLGRGEIHDVGVYTSNISYSELDPFGYKQKPAPDGVQVPSASSSAAPSAPAIPSRASKPSTTGASMTMEELNKSVVVASDLVDQFLATVGENTERNIETCGILCGKMLRNKFIISHVVLPKQTGASDGCTAHGEEDVFRYQDKEGMITMGWIHTHPSQTAFLSSIDLHTQHAYQLMMPEAIAIVCAPKHSEVGVFTMTVRGMDVVGACTQTSGFHPHDEAVGEKLFMNADHVHFSEKLHVNIVDLRH